MHACFDSREAFKDGFNVWLRGCCGINIDGNDRGDTVTIITVGSLFKAPVSSFI